MSICKQCEVYADIFTQNVKNWGYDAAISNILPSISEHTHCEYVDCYCQHTIEKGAYVNK